MWHHVLWTFLIMLFKEGHILMTLMVSGFFLRTNKSVWRDCKIFVRFIPADKCLDISLTHWGRVTHTCVSDLTSIGSDNGLSPSRRQAIIWTNAGILLIGPLGTNFSENSIEILTFSFTKMRLKVSSAKWWPFCLGLNVLILACYFD